MVATTFSDSTYSNRLVATKILSLNLLVTIFKLLAAILVVPKKLNFL